MRLAGKPSPGSQTWIALAGLCVVVGGWRKLIPLPWRGLQAAKSRASNVLDREKPQAASEWDHHPSVHLSPAVPLQGRWLVPCCHLPQAAGHSPASPGLKAPWERGQGPRQKTPSHPTTSISGGTPRQEMFLQVTIYSAKFVHTQPLTKRLLLANP